MARTSAEVVSLIREGRIAEMRHKFGAKIDPDLKAIIAKATAYDREKRYQSIRELASDLRCYMAGEETSANPYNIFGKISAFAVHHKRASLVSAIFCILLLLLTIGVTCYRNVSRINAVHNYSREIGEAMIRSTASDSVTLATGMSKSLAMPFMPRPPAALRGRPHDRPRRISGHVPTRVRCALRAPPAVRR